MEAVTIQARLYILLHARTKYAVSVPLSPVTDAARHIMAANYLGEIEASFYL